MNKELRRVSLFAGILFLALLVNVTYRSVVDHDSNRKNEYNVRVLNDAFGKNRGSILAGTTAIAVSEPAQGTFKFARKYPEGSLYSHVTGWYTYRQGSSALEYNFGQELAGSSDSLQLTRMFDEFTGKQPKGGTLETSLQPKLQRAARDALGQRKGAVVAISPKTGAIKALVSTPDFDPNTLATHDFKAAAKAFQSAEKDPERPLLNRAAREVFPPGSTFKLVVTAAALEKGMNPETMIDTPARLTLPGTSSVLTNQGNCGNTQVSLAVALRDSCNTSFANLGMQLGEESLAAQAKKFGFGARHLGDLGGVASRFPTGMNQAQLAQSSIGQFDVAATPVQMAMVVAAIANDGVVMEPHVVTAVRGSNLEVVKTIAPKEVGRAMSSANASTLQQLMVDVVEKGSGKQAAIRGRKVGGKTGTSEHGVGAWPYGWFAAFAPDADLAVITFVQDAPDVDDSLRPYAGSAIAAPMARQVLQAALS